jgi:hypothetical protein
MQHAARSGAAFMSHHGLGSRHQRMQRQAACSTKWRCMSITDTEAPISRHRLMHVGSSSLRHTTPRSGECSEKDAAVHACSPSPVASAVLQLAACTTLPPNTLSSHAMVHNPAAHCCISSCLAQALLRVCQHCVSAAGLLCHAACSTKWRCMSHIKAPTDACWIF